MNKTFSSDLPILLIDDEEIVLRAITRALRSNGIQNTISISDSRKVMDVLEQQEVSFILLDLNMPHISGEALLQQIVAEYPFIPVIMATANDDVTTIVTCIKNGAFDYIVKPIDTGRLLSAARCAIEVRELRSEKERLIVNNSSKKIKSPEAFAHISTANEEMFGIFKYIEAIAGTSQPVIVTGETGVGKELIVQAIHTLSGRQGELVPVSVAGLDDTIFSDTLFGHVKGAYTGADNIRAGQINIAAAGTLFLDEIGDLSMQSQVKLLRLVQEKEFMQLGSDKIESTETRIIVATHQDLNALKESGKFRKDLYFRLNAHHIHIPPLRKRLSDLPLLVERFFKEAALELQKKVPTVPAEVYTILGTYHFPGNIRELKAMIFDAVSKHEAGVMSLNTFRSVIDGNMHQISGHTSSQSLVEFGEMLPTLKEVRRLLVTEAMDRSNDNMTVASKLVGITRQSLGQYLKSNPIRQTESD